MKPLRSATGGEQRVVTQREFGGPEVLRTERRAVPDPLPTEIRVRVRAAGVNPVDAKTRAGAGMAPVIGDPPFVLGWDVAGVVDRVGHGVTLFEPGDRVMGMPWFPRQAAAYAEYTTGPSRQFVAVPAGMSDEQAGALPLAGLTAWQALVDVAKVAAGDRVLVHAAAGGVGHLAVQIAAARGAWVAGTASESGHGLLRQLGVDRAIDYHDPDAFDRTDEVDVVVDLVGGDTSRRSVPLLRPGGHLAVVAGPVTQEVSEMAAARGISVRKLLVEPDGAGLRHLAGLVRAGRLRVEVAGTFDLEAAAAAHTEIETGHTRGKLVLVPG